MEQAKVVKHKEISINDSNSINMLKNILNSSWINVLIGAGVNASTIGVLDGEKFKITNDFIEERKTKDGSFEDKINSLNDADRKKAMELFVRDFNVSYGDMAWEKSQSYNNIKDFFKSLYYIVNLRETRKEFMKKINIFTLNYDDILENAIDELGFAKMLVDVSKDGQISKCDLTCYDINKDKFVPTFSIIKLHGSMVRGKLNEENIITPGDEKFDKAINKKFFELIFKFKSELLKQNALLLIFGYSGNDEHINQIICDAISRGLTVINFEYNEEKKDNNLISKSNEIIIAKQISKGQDTIKNFVELVKKMELDECQLKSEE